MKPSNAAVTAAKGRSGSDTSCRRVVAVRGLSDGVVTRSGGERFGLAGTAGDSPRSLANGLRAPSTLLLSLGLRSMLQFAVAGAVAAGCGCESAAKATAGGTP